MAKAPTAANPTSEVPAIDADGYKTVGGYSYKDVDVNGRAALEIKVSDSKRIVTQALKMSEQFDLFEMLSSSTNAVYRTMASIAASVRAHGTQPVGQPVMPVFFPKTVDDLKQLLDDLDEDGIAAILAVQAAITEASTTPDVATAAKN